jgi:hypothetical protein
MVPVPDKPCERRFHDRVLAVKMAAEITHGLPSLFDDDEDRELDEAGGAELEEAEQAIADPLPRHRRSPSWRPSWSFSATWKSSRTACASRARTPSGSSSVKSSTSRRLEPMRQGMGVFFPRRNAFGAVPTLRPQSGQGSRADPRNVADASSPSKRGSVSDLNGKEKSTDDT